MLKIQKRSSVFFLIFFFNSLVYGEAQASRAVYVMGTILEITVSGGNIDSLNKAVETSFLEVKRLDAVMSLYEKNSLLSKINQEGAGKWIKSDKDLYEVLSESIKFSKLTDGAFDISIPPLMNLWENYAKRGEIPTKKNLKKILPLVNYKNIILNQKNKTVMLSTPEMKLDLGGIGKGYAIVKIIDILKKNHIRDAAINFGGNLYFFGNSTHKTGIRNPLNEKKILLELNAKNQAVSTSGGYERFLTIGGKKYSHIINPVTGLPAAKVISATVITTNPVTADALSTALSVMPPAKGINLINKLSGIEAILILSDKTGSKISKIMISDRLKNKVKFNNFYQKRR